MAAAAACRKEKIKVHCTAACITYADTTNQWPPPEASTISPVISKCLGGITILVRPTALITP